MMYAPNDILQVSISNHTTGQIVAAPSDATQAICVVGFMLSLDAAGEFYFENGTSGDDLTGAIEVLADTPVGAFSGAGVLQAVGGQRLDLECTAAANGWLRYVLVRA